MNMVCNEDCFHCPYEDCILDEITLNAFQELRDRRKPQPECKAKSTYIRKDYKKEYFKKYYKANREDLLSYQAAYNASHIDKKAGYRAMYYEAHKNEIAVQQAVYAKEHRAEKNAINRVYYKRHKEEITKRHMAYRAKNIDKIRAYDREWKAAHKDEINARRRECYRQKKEQAAAEAAKLQNQQYCDTLEKI